jgi:hypothetical protein
MSQISTVERNNFLVGASAETGKSIILNQLSVIEIHEKMGYI